MKQLFILPLQSTFLQIPHFDTPVKWMLRARSAFPAQPSRCSGFAWSNFPCGQRQTPCLYFSRTAANARVRSAGVLTRSQFISKALAAAFPSFSASIFAVKPSSQRLLFLCAAACGTALAFSAFRPAVVSARRNWRRI